ncbi:zinc finger, CCHC-type containing protein [Tanacetum coccineum]
MGDENPIRTLGDYSKPSHEGYRNTIELPERNNVVPLRSDTIRLVQNECSFHGLRSVDPNQHLKDFLKLVDSLDLDRSISTWEDLTTRFLAQLFPLGRTAKLRNDILMFQQHHGESLSEAWTRFKDHVNPITRRTIDQSAGGKLRDLNPEESWAILEDLALYDNEMVPTTLRIAWKTPNKPLLNTHLHVSMKREDEMIGKINLLWKTVFEKLNNASAPKNTRSLGSISHDEKEELKKNGIKSPTNSDTEEEDTSPTNEPEHELDDMVRRSEGVKEQEVEEVFEEEEEDKDDESFNSFPTMKELSHHEWLLKHP